MRRWAGQWAPIAAAGAVVWLLAATFPWVLIWWSAASLLWLCGWILGHAAGCAKAAEQCQRWQDQCDAFEAELTQAEATIARLNANVDVLSRNVVEAYKSGQVDGQLFQAERREHGL